MGEWLKKGRKARRKGGCRLPMRRNLILELTDVRGGEKWRFGKVSNGPPKARLQHWL